MKATKTLVTASVVAATMAFCGADASAHGFSVPRGTPSIGSGSNSSAGNNNAGNTGGQATPTNAGAPTTGGTTPGFGRPGTTPGGRGPAGGGGTGPGRGGLPFGANTMSKPRKSADKAFSVEDRAGRTATPGDLPLESAARGKALKNLLRSDGATDSDLSYVIEAKTTDSRLRAVELRMNVSERRSVRNDVARRVEVQVKSGDVWETVEIALLRRVGGLLQADRWTPAEGVKRVKDADSASIAGTKLSLGDVAPFDLGSSTLRYVSANDVDGAVNETYRLGATSLDDQLVTFRMDLRAPTRHEFRRGGDVRRAYDWAGWRFVAGMPVPSRLTVTGASGETTTLVYAEAAANAGFDAKLFDAAQLGAR